MIQLADFQREIHLSDTEKQQGFWMQDDVHLAHAVSPLFASFQIPAMTEGTKKAFENLKLPISQFVVKLSDGRIYQANLPYPGDPQERIQEHQEHVKPLLPVLKQRLLDVVESTFLPFYAKLDAARIQTETLQQAKEQVLELHQFYKTAWQLHFELVIPRGAISMGLEHLYRELANDSQTTVIYEMLTGVMNKTLETDRGLWKLAQAAQDSPPVKTLLRSVPVEEASGRLQESAEGTAFLTRLQSFLDEYGYRSPNSHEFMDETWVENPVHALAIISSYLQKEYDFDQEFAQIVRDRETRAKEILAKMPEGETKQFFLHMYEWALDSWGLDEDHHFYIDAMLPAKSRLFFLRVGELLVRADVLKKREDIFYLYLDELIGVLENPAPVFGLIEERKREHEENKRKHVPPFYGTPPEKAGDDPITERVFGTKAPDINEEAQTFTGYAASQGVYTGTVKVVRGPEEFAKVEKGDVLVCKTTTPPWTVLFSVVGAVVTDAGGILSHAGTVAREYRLPSVVGCKIATRVLKDGDTVTVDGSSGVVYFGQK